MNEALLRQLRCENDGLRREVNQLHQTLYKLRLQNKQMKQGMASMQEQIEKEKMQKEHIKV